MVSPTLYFYPRSPCGERQASADCFGKTTLFLSTLSLRRATCTLRSVAPLQGISIHALLAESDYRFSLITLPKMHFYPRSPCGERRVTVLGIQHKVGISIHALLAESDSPIDVLAVSAVPISIHALLAESDDKSNKHAGQKLVFLSTLSLRRATAKVHKTVGHFCAYETNFMGIASSC